MKRTEDRKGEKTMGIDLKDKKCLVFGMGVSGKAAAALLLREGARVILYDEKEGADLGVVRSFFEEKDNISFVCGRLPESIKQGIDLLILSPGVPMENPLVSGLSGFGVKTIGEIELAYACGKGRVLAITGTNGKTTTTTLLGDIMKAYSNREGKGRKVFVVGNIGDPYTACADRTEEDSVTVAEISSFQLETIETFKPSVSAILNITPDHLNRHHTMDNYIAMKRRITENQDEKDRVILNYDDPITRDMAKGMRPGVVFFTRKPEEYVPEEGRDLVSLKDGEIFYNDRSILRTDEVNLLGSHNYENIMAAVGMAVNAGVPDTVIRDTVREFKAVEHRIEFVDNKDGADYYNDSKGTNPDASIKAVEAMVKPCILIAGGYDKDSSYDELIEACKGKVKLLVLLGETAGKIRDCAEAHGFNEILFADSLEEAVRICHDNARPGDAVLLSPACASWDMFKNYEERGRLFKELVKSL